MDRSRYDDEVGGFHGLKDRLHVIVDDAIYSVFVLLASEAGSAACDVAFVDIKKLDLRAGFLQFVEKGTKE